jgi:hypothetical protein
MAVNLPAASSICKRTHFLLTATNQDTALSPTCILRVATLHIYSKAILVDAKLAAGASVPESNRLPCRLYLLLRNLVFLKIRPGPHESSITSLAESWLEREACIFMIICLCRRKDWKTAVGRNSPQVWRQSRERDYPSWAPSSSRLSEDPSAIARGRKTGANVAYLHISCMFQPNYRQTAANPYSLPFSERWTLLSN